MISYVTLAECPSKRWLSATSVETHTRHIGNQMIFESFLHKNPDGEFFICMKSQKGTMIAPDGSKKDEMWFGPFKTEDAAVDYADRMHQAINDEMIERGARLQ